MYVKSKLTTQSLLQTKTTFCVIYDLKWNFCNICLIKLWDLKGSFSKTTVRVPIKQLSEETLNTVSDFVALFQPTSLSKAIQKETNFKSQFEKKRHHIATVRAKIHKYTCIWQWSHADDTNFESRKNISKR